MNQTSESSEGEEYGEAELNHRGRLTIPKALRDEMHLEAGDTFRVIRDGAEIRLVRQLPELETLSSGKSRDEWADADAFRDAGDATFGGR
jgi:AbrB family looped-hinge helix DNA binding protein